jgi:capsular polysaccharide biosynthesis protein
LSKISWKAIVLCAVVSVAAAAVAYAIGNSLHRVYQSSGTIRVGVPTQAGIDDPVVLAENDIATQDAQLVGSDPVKALAAKTLGVSPGSLDGKLSGSTVGAQNLIQVTASGSSREQAQARAGAAVGALEQYLNRMSAQQSAQYLRSLHNGVNGTALGANVPSGTSLSSGDRRQLAISAAGQRDQLLAQGVHDATGNRPNFQVVDAGTSASLTSPQPKLYALVALLVALIVTGRVAFMAARRRRSDHAAQFNGQLDRERREEFVGAGRP